MTKHLKKLVSPLVSLIFLLSMTSTGFAETTVSAEVQAIFNSFLFLVCGFLVMFMACGFAMLESGMVTSKSVSVICAKNIGLYSIAGIMFWMVGYNLAYGIPEGGYIGTFTPWSDASAVDTGYADGSDWYSKWYFVLQQSQSYQEHWQKELNYGHSSYSQQFYQESFIQLSWDGSGVVDG